MEGHLSLNLGLLSQKEYYEENLSWVERGCENLLHCIEIVKKSGTIPVVCINRFYTDTKNELNLVKRYVKMQSKGCYIWSLAKRRRRSFRTCRCSDRSLWRKNEFKHLYDLNESVKERIEKIAKEVYKADGVIYSATAEEKIKLIEANEEIKNFLYVW